MLYCLSQRPVNTERNEANEIVNELGFLPLAIAQAASYIQQRIDSLRKFLDRYRLYRKDVYKEVPRGNRQYSFSIATTWTMSFELLTSRRPSSAQLLQLLSFLNPDLVLIELLEYGKAALKPDLQELLSQRPKLEEALLDLESFSLVKWHRAACGVSIHRLVQNVVRDQLSQSQIDFWKVTIVEMLDKGFPERMTSRSRHRYHDQVVEPLLKLSALEPMTRTAEVLERIGKLLYDDGNLRDSHRMFFQSLKIVLKLSPSKKPELQSAYTELARSFWAKGHWDEAVVMQEKALASSKLELGDKDPNTLIRLNNLAVTYGSLGRLSEALERQKEAFAISRKMFGEHDQNTLNVKNNLGVIYHSLGLWNDAAALQQDILQTRMKLLGEEHPDTLNAMDNLATTFWSSGEFDETIKLQQKTLEIKWKVLGETHPDTLKAMNNLALTLGDLDKLDESAEFLERSYYLNEQVLGAESPETLKAMSNLGLTYAAQGRVEEATELQEKSYKTCNRVIGQRNPLTLTVTHGLAETFLSNNRINAAEMLETEVLSQRESVLGMHHPDTRMTRESLKLIHKKGKFIIALDFGTMFTGVAFANLLRDERDVKKIAESVYVIKTWPNMSAQ